MGCIKFPSPLKHLKIDFLAECLPCGVELQLGGRSGEWYSLCEFKSVSGIFSLTFTVSSQFSILIKYTFCRSKLCCFFPYLNFQKFKKNNPFSLFLAFLQSLGINMQLGGGRGTGLEIPADWTGSPSYSFCSHGR